MASLMTETASLEIIYGVPLCPPEGDPDDHQAERLEDDQIDLIANSYVSGIEPGLMSIGDPNNASVVFGIPVSSVNLHDNPHHISFPQIAPAALEDAQKHYQNLLSATSPKLLAAIRRLSNVEPSLIMVLNLQD